MAKFFLVLYLLFSYIIAYGDTVRNFSISFNKENYIFSIDDKEELSIESKLDYTTYSCNHGDYLMPLSNYNYIIPSNKTYKQSSYTVTTSLLYENVKLNKNKPQDSNLKDFSNLNIENASNDYKQFFYEGKSSWSDMTILHFGANPFIYDEDKLELRFISKMDITIELSDNPNTQNSQDTICSPQWLSEPLLKNTWIDESYKNEQRKILSPGSSLTSKALEYLIITNKELLSSWEELLIWKKKKGVKSKIVSVESIAEQYSGDDLPLKIKKYIRASNMLGCKYVLLGGDDTVVPVRYCGENRKTYNPFLIFPADLYYACFGGNFDWDGNRDGIYGSVADSINLVPSVSISRCPVRTPQDVKNFTEKLIAYERYGKWNNSILMAGKEIMTRGSFHNYSIRWGDEILNEYISPYWNGTATRFYDDDTDFDEGADYDFSLNNFAQQLSRGYGFVNVITHGSQTGWQQEDQSEMNQNQLMQLLLNSKTSIITTESCLTCAFDSSDVKGLSQDPSLCEALIRNKESGVIAFLGHARETRFSTNKKLEYINQWIAEFYKSIFTNEAKHNHWADVVNQMKSNFVAASLKSGSPNRELQLGVNALGDPEMPIYTRQPSNLPSISFNFHPDTLSLFIPYDSCKVCLYNSDNNGSEYFKVYENFRTIKLYNTPNTFSICITKPNYKPDVFSVKRINFQPYWLVPYKVTDQPIDSTTIAIRNIGIVPTIKKCTYNKFTDCVEIAIELDNHERQTSIIISSLYGEIELNTNVSNVDDLINIYIGRLSKGIHIVSLKIDGTIVDSKRILKL